MLECQRKVPFSQLLNLSHQALSKLKECDVPKQSDVTSFISLLSAVHQSHLSREEIARLTFPPKFRDVVAHTDIVFSVSDDELALLASSFDKLELMNKKVAYQLYMAASDKRRFCNFSLHNLVTFASGLRQFRDQHPAKKVFVEENDKQVT